MAEASRSEPRAEDEMNVNDTVILRDLPVGTKVRLRSGAIGEITGNPQDGAWIFLRYVESPKDPAKVGTEDMAFCTEVIAVVA
jgi:hypothetical protein